MVATVLAAPLYHVSPYLVPSAPVAYAAPVHHVAYAAPVHYYAPAVHTKIHYENTPVVVGHSTQILKPALTAPLAFAHAPAVVVKTEEKAAEEKVEEKTVHLAYAAHPAPFVSPFAYGVPAVLNVKAPVPAGEAPSMDQLVQKQKVLAPVRAVSDVTSQVTVQHPTKVNVEKVVVDVPVATPYAHPVPVAVAAPYEIHHVHTPSLTVVA